MSAWCEVGQVEEYLKSVAGRNWNPDSILLRIERATLTIKTDLGGVLTKTQLDAWDADLAVVPPTIQMLCAGLAAANVLQDYVQMQSLADPQSKAGGLFKMYVSSRDAIIKNKGILTTSDSDNTVITITASTITSSTATATPVFSRGTSSSSPGTLDNFNNREYDS